jgi:hypothetical protein
MAMKRTLRAFLTLAIVTAAAAGAPAAKTRQRAERTLTACLQAEPEIAPIVQPVWEHAEVIANQILAGAGVKIKWHANLRSCAGGLGKGILITLTGRTPPNEHPGALAYAQPFEDRIGVYYDRVLQASQHSLFPGLLLPSLLGHVLAHEITHVLEGTDRHAETGLMKARWDAGDYERMTRRLFTLTEADIQLIDLGLETRARIADRQQRLESMTARAERNVTIYVSNDLNTRGVLYQAQERAAKMFAEAGVRIDWRIGRPSGAQPEREPVIVVSLEEHAPAGYSPEALASAKVYEGVHITVFWDRVERLSRFAQPAVVLAHVLVHEITHILQGIDRHSESGVMKAHWTPEDYRAMAAKPLPFTPQDVKLIQLGLAPPAEAGAMAPANSAPKTTN